jgi:hypothetical protein
LMLSDAMCLGNDGADDDEKWMKAKILMESEWACGYWLCNKKKVIKFFTFFSLSLTHTLNVHFN